MTILETIPIFEQPGTYAPLVFISLICSLIFLFIAGILYTNDFDTSGSVFTIITVISIIIFVISVVLTITEPKINTGRKQYIIRVDENTPINEIYDNYKIIEHTKYTDVYTVEELEND
jgi:hypothetical protein